MGKMQVCSLPFPVLQRVAILLKGTHQTPSLIRALSLKIIFSHLKYELIFIFISINSSHQALLDY